MDKQDWTEITCTEADEFDDLIEEIIRLQERVRALEKRHEMPDNTFWCQMFYNVFLFLFVVVVIVGWAF